MDLLRDSLFALLLVVFAVGCNGDKKRGLALVHEGRDLLVKVGSLRAAAVPPATCPDGRLRALGLPAESLKVELLDSRMLPVFRVRPAPGTRPTSDQMAMLKRDVELDADRTRVVIPMLGKDLPYLASELSHGGLRWAEDEELWNELMVNELKGALERAKAHRFIGVVEVTAFKLPTFGETTNVFGTKTDRLEAGGHYITKMVPGMLTGRITIFDRDTGEVLCGHEVSATNSETISPGSDEAAKAAEQDLAYNFVHALDTGSKVLSIK